MSTPYCFTPDAQSDLLEIRRLTVAQWGLAQSRKYFLELRKTIQLLAQSPFMGRLQQELGPNVLSFPYNSHRIYYMVHEQRLTVFAVLHKHMLPLNHLLEREVI